MPDPTEPAPVPPTPIPASAPVLATGGPQFYAAIVTIAAIAAAVALRIANVIPTDALGTTVAAFAGVGISLVLGHSATQAASLLRAPCPACEETKTALRAAYAEPQRATPGARDTDLKTP